MIITPEQLRAAYSKLPVVIREYLSGEELSTVTEAIGTKYGLHVDTVGAVNREASNMLLGLINPTQFVGELKSAGIPDATIAPLVQELNEKVFMPLHKKMQEPDAARESGTNDNVPPEVKNNLEVSAPTNNQSRSVPPTPSFVPTAPIASIQPPPPMRPPIPASITPSVRAPAPALFVPQTSTPPAEEHDVRTMASDMALVKSGGFPHESTPITSAPARPVFVPTPPPRPLVATPPIVSPPQIASAPFVPPAMPRTLAPQSENREALHEILKSYGVDPYREPPE